MRYWHAVVPSLNLAYIGEPMDAASGHVWQARAYDEILIDAAEGCTLCGQYIADSALRPPSPRDAGFLPAPLMHREASPATLGKHIVYSSRRSVERTISPFLYGCCVIHNG